MSIVTFYFQAHQPKRLRKNPRPLEPFDNQLDKKVFQKVASKCYLPANAMFAGLIEKHEKFRICLSVSGTLLEQAKLFMPEVVESFA